MRHGMRRVGWFQRAKVSANLGGPFNISVSPYLRVSVATHFGIGGLSIGKGVDNIK